MTNVIASKNGSEYCVKVNEHTDADVCHVISTLVQGLSVMLHNNKRVFVSLDVQSSGSAIIRWSTRNKRADEDFMYFLIMAKMLEVYSPDSLKLITNLENIF